MFIFGCFCLFFALLFAACLFFALLFVVVFFFFALLFVVVMQENNNTVKVKIVKALLQRTSVGREFTLSSQQKVTSRSLVSSLEH